MKPKHKQAQRNSPQQSKAIFYEAFICPTKASCVLKNCTKVFVARFLLFSICNISSNNDQSFQLSSLAMPHTAKSAKRCPRSKVSPPWFRFGDRDLEESMMGLVKNLHPQKCRFFFFAWIILRMDRNPIFSRFDFLLLKKNDPRQAAAPKASPFIQPLLRVVPPRDTLYVKHAFQLASLLDPSLFRRR